MSKIGKINIPIPDKVKVLLSGNIVNIEMVKRYYRRQTVDRWYDALKLYHGLLWEEQDVWEAERVSREDATQCDDCCEKLLEGWGHINESTIRKTGEGKRRSKDREH